MREILFRGKRKDNGEWVEGNFYESRMSGCFILQAKIKARTNRKTGYTIFGDEAIPFEVDPSTVGQYTGLTDKNGKRIFEGDIVTAYFDGRESEPFQVCYGQFHDANSVFEDDDFIGWSLASPKFPGEYITILSEVKNGMQYEVVGNIHDNPELLGGR